jgi:sugar lactone lactonase YvrE
MVAVADLNGDRRVDLAVTNMRSDDVTILLNQGPAPLQVASSQPEARPPTEVTPLELSSFRYPNGLSVDPSGTYLLVSDQQNHRIARVEIATGKITTVAGTGEPGSEGDGGPAVGARLRLPNGVAMDGEGNIFIADFGNNRIRKVDPSGIISSVVGTGEAGHVGDGGPALSAQLNGPFGVTLDPAGSLYIADFGNNRIRKVDPSGIITTLAGGDRARASGGAGAQGEPALGAVTGLALDANGELLLADQFNFRIRKLAADGALTTVAGSGRKADAWEGGPATAIQLSYPSGVAADAEGNIYIADQNGNRILRVTRDGIIHLHVGQTGKLGYSGDGGLATEARIWFPSHVATDAQGNLFFTDRFNHCIRKVDPSGIITTVAGSPDPKALADLADRLETNRLKRRRDEALRPLASDARLRLEWEYKFRSGSDANAAYAVAIDEKGGIYLAGDVGSGADWRILHLDPDGKRLWSFDFDSGNVDVPFALTLTPDGQVVAAGTVLGRERTYALVISLSRAGKENWRYEGGGKGRPMLRGIASDEKSNLYVVGQSDRKWTVQSLSPAGKLRWTYEGGDGSARAVDVDRRGHVFVAGNERRAWRVIELDSAGKVVSRTGAEQASRIPSAMAHGLRLHADGGAVVAGNQTLRGGHVRVERLAATGERLWDYLGSAGVGAAGRAVDIDSKGNAFVVGDFASDWLMLALDPSGKLLWRFTYDGGGGPRNADQAHAVAVHPAGGFVVAGVIHPVPPRHPSLGAVEWRVARYRVLTSEGKDES